MRSYLRSAVNFPGTYRRNKVTFLINLVGFAIVVGVVLAALLLRSRLDPSLVGYTGVALSALLASGGLLIPVPALVIVCSASLFLVPLLVGVVAGVAETAGELTGYYLGYNGRHLVTGRFFYHRVERWMRTRGWLLLFLLALVPNPIFDVVGIAAGLIRYPLWRFLGVVAAGKLLKFIALSYACAFSVEWLTQLVV